MIFIVRNLLTDHKTTALTWRAAVGKASRIGSYVEIEDIETGNVFDMCGNPIEKATARPCFTCKQPVRPEEWEIVRGKDPAVTWEPGIVCCERCADDIHDGAEEVEMRHAQQKMIEEALTFIGDYGAEAWNEIVAAVVEQAK